MKSARRNKKAAQPSQELRGLLLSFLSSQRLFIRTPAALQFIQKSAGMQSSRLRTVPPGSQTIHHSCIAVG